MGAGEWRSVSPNSEGKDDHRMTIFAFEHYPDMLGSGGDIRTGRMVQPDAHGALGYEVFVEGKNS